jgi:hypothetical protein
MNCTQWDVLWSCPVSPYKWRGNPTKEFLEKAKSSFCLIYWAPNNEDECGMELLQPHSWPSHWTEVSGQLHAYASSPSARELPIPIWQEAEWVPEPVWMPWRGHPFISPAENRTPCIRSVAHHYIDWAIPAKVSLAEFVTSAFHCYNSVTVVLKANFQHNNARKFRLIKWAEFTKYSSFLDSLCAFLRELKVLN